VTDSPADELMAAVRQLRPSSPAVAAHTVAVRLHPRVVDAVADLLERQGRIAAEVEQHLGEEFQDGALDQTVHDALAVARAVLDRPEPAAPGPAAETPVCAVCQRPADDHPGMHDPSARRATPGPDDDRRERYKAALWEFLNGPYDAVLLERAADAVLAVADAEQADLRAQLADAQLRAQQVEELLSAAHQCSNKAERHRVLAVQRAERAEAEAWRLTGLLAQYADRGIVNGARAERRRAVSDHGSAPADLHEELRPLALVIDRTLRGTPVRFGDPADLITALTLAVAAYMGRVVSPGPTRSRSIIAYRSNGGRLLRCLQHAPQPDVRDSDFSPVTAEDLEDGGVCTSPGCGVDVLLATVQEGKQADQPDATPHIASAHSPDGPKEPAEGVWKRRAEILLNTVNAALRYIYDLERTPDRETIKAILLGEHSGSKCRRCGCPANSPDCTHCNCCDVPVVDFPTVEQAGLRAQHQQP